MPATAASLVHLTGMIPDDATWSVIGIGRAQTPMAALAIVMGGHARVGLEDNISYRRGELATSNAQLVGAGRQARRRARSRGRDAGRGAEDLGAGLTVRSRDAGAVRL